MAPIKGNTEGQHKAGWLKVLGLKRWHVHAKNKYRASVIQKFQIWILEEKKNQNSGSWKKKNVAHDAVYMKGCKTNPHP